MTFLALASQAAEPSWPSDPPIPVMKPILRPALFGAETLRLDYLMLASLAPSGASRAPIGARSDAGTASVVLETQSAVALESALPQASEANAPLPVPKPGAPVPARLANDAAGAASSLWVELPLSPQLVSSLAAIEAAAASGGPSQRAPFAPPPLTTSIAVSLDSNAFRFALPKSGDFSIVPSLEMVGLPPEDPNLVRMSAPHDPRVTPTPGLDAVMTLGDVILDAKVNQPLRAVETKAAPDTRPLADRSNFGVDMKLKF